MLLKMFSVAICSLLLKSTYTICVYWRVHWTDKVSVANLLLMQGGGCMKPTVIQGLIQVISKTCQISFFWNLCVVQASEKWGLQWQRPYHWDTLLYLFCKPSKSPLPMQFLEHFLLLNFCPYVRKQTDNVDCGFLAWCTESDILEGHNESASAENRSCFTVITVYNGFQRFGFLLKTAHQWKRSRGEFCLQWQQNAVHSCHGFLWSFLVFLLKMCPRSIIRTLLTKRGSLS